MGDVVDIAGISTYATGDGDRCVVVLHEWWGLVPHIRDVCDRFARAGYRSFAPDMYDGAMAPETEPDKAAWLASRLDRERAAARLAGVVAELRGGGHERVGLVGFCMGSALAIATTARCAVEATVGYYGVWPKSGERTITSPILIHVAGLETDDNWWSQAEPMRRWFRGMPNVEIVVYEGAQHAFFNDVRPDLYDPTAAAASWTRTLAFLDAHLAAK